MEKHKIDWLNMMGFKGETWNPIIGCSKVSAGCKNCYAEKMAFRLSNIALTKNKPTALDYYVDIISWGRWNGKTEFVEPALKKPLHWKKPRMIFVCSMSDLFHETIWYSWIDAVFETISRCPEHIFIILTKRPENMADYYKKRQYGRFHNVWIGTTAENQETANKRIPILLDIPAAKRFVSIEPMLGEIDLSRFLPEGHWGIHPTKGKMFYPKYFMSKCAGCGWIGSSEYWEGGGPIGDTGDHFDHYCPKCEGQEPDEIDNNISWVIVGGESGHNARPMHPDWVCSIRDQCKEANTPFFFKQWGEYTHSIVDRNGECKFFKVGKSKSGNELDGKYHKEFPNFE